MSKVDLNAEPALSVIKMVSEINPNVEVVDGQINRDFYHFKIQSSNTMRTTEQFSIEHLSDIFGKHNAHLYTKLELKLRNAINRIK
ncbi:MAG: hypothetical protein ABSF70_19210 [Terracidiphilus sp.]|jgi:hypothetical protein